VLALVGADALQGMMLAEVLALVGADVSKKTGSVATGGSGGEQTPIPFLHRSNAGAHNGFVSTSAIISVVGQYMNFTTPLQALSLTNLCCTSMCLARERWTYVDQVTDECKCTSGVREDIHRVLMPVEIPHKIAQAQSLLTCICCCNEFSFSS
jgi:hypothetical protein